MNSRLMLGFAGVALAVATLSGCASGSGGGSLYGEDEEAPTEEAPAAAAAISTAETDLGEIVVDGDGMTAYYFDKDTADSGVSACTGGCLAAWPPILSESETPEVDGVTGEVGTIPTPDGKLQVTIDGMPIYLYAADAAPGDTTGQGVSDVWWVVAPDGSKVQ